MRTEMTQAATEAAARVVSPIRLYHAHMKKSMVINEMLARLVFGLENPSITLAERTSVLDVIDRLIRLKVEGGLLTGVQHGR